MITAIPNPTRSFQLEMPKDEVNDALEQLHLFTDKYKLFKANRIMNQFTFEASEFLSLGVYIDVNTFATTDRITQVNIEIRRKLGTFNQPHEVSLANQHIAAMGEIISKCISTDQEDRRQMIKRIEDKKVQVEKERIEKAKEAHRKSEEQRINQPFLYYSKQAIMWILVLAMMGGVGYAAYVVFFK